MLRKRLIGAIIVRKGWAVQSIGYKRWLPLGKPECLAENLDRWGADGIVVLCIDRENQGPDLELIRRLGDLGLATPLTYGGGIKNEKDARQAVKDGAERLVLDSILYEDSSKIKEMGDAVGVQALVASLPLIIEKGGEVKHWRHREGISKKITSEISEIIREEAVSELLAIDVENEGSMREDLINY